MREREGESRIGGILAEFAPGSSSCTGHMTVALWYDWLSRLSLLDLVGALEARGVASHSPE